MLSRTFRLHILACAVLLPCSALCLGSPAPTPRELLALIDVSKEKFETYDVTVSYEAFAFRGGGYVDAAPSSTGSVRTRKSANRVLSQTDVTSRAFSPTSGEFEAHTSRREYLNTPGWSKHLLSGERSGDTLGGVSPTPSAQALTAFSPFRSVYLYTEIYREWLDHETTHVVTLEDGTCLLETVPEEGERFKVSITVDPKFGYLPVRTAVSMPDGVPVRTVETSDIREVAPGIWIPFRFTEQEWAAGIPGRDGSISHFTLESVAINTRLVDEDLEIEFPEGTRVHDEVAGITYRVAQGDKGVELLEVEPMTVGKAYASAYWHYALFATVIALGGARVFLKSRHRRRVSNKDETGARRP